MASSVQALLRDLVSIRSLSGHEEAARDYVASVLRDAGVEALVSGRNVWAVRGEAGPLLLFNSHLDTVPPGAGWSGDPWTPRERGGRLVGLGVNDAKAALASMLAAFVALGDPLGGRLLFAATCDEETGGEGLESLMRELPRPDGAVIGEPNGFEVAIGQKGLVKLECTARGRTGHAARPHQAENAIYRAARDIARIEALRFDASDPILGSPSVAVTMLQGGVKSNVVPDVCRFTIDGRTVPCFDNARLTETVRRTVECEVTVLSDRLRPVAGSPESAIVRAARSVRPSAALTGFDGVTDLVHVAPVPGIVFGPGTGAASHQPDEWIDLDAVDEAPEIYAALARAFFDAARETAGGAAR
jgi:acetylornithine deacetylase